MKLLSNAEISARLRYYRYDERANVPFARIAHFCDIDYRTLATIMEGHMQEKYRLRVSTVIFALDMGILEVKREVFNGPIKDFLNDIPSAPQPPQDKITRKDEWNKWAQCRTCSGRNWSDGWKSKLAVKICSNCIPPEQMKSLYLDKKNPFHYKAVRERALTNGIHNQGIRLPRLRRKVRVRRRRPSVP